MSDNQQLATVPEHDFSAVLASQNSKAVFLPANLGEAMQLANFMAGGIGVRQWMRGNPSACLALIQISMRWGLDPYIVSNKAYYANDTLSFESQLVNAVINTSGQLIGRLSIEFAGDATGGVGKETLNCRVSGRLKANPEKVVALDQALNTITIRNSPLWKTNPKLQLAYHTTRSWARLYMPEVLLGIYTPDEVADGVAQRIEQQSQPKSDVKAPDRREFQEPEGEDAQFEEIRPVVHEEDARAEGANAADVLATDEDVDAAGPTGAVPAGSGRDMDDSEGNGSAGNGDIVGERPVEQPKDILDTVPREQIEWDTWKSAFEDTLPHIATRDQFDALRRRIAPVMEAADPKTLDIVQDALTDKLMALPEKVK